MMFNTSQALIAGECFWQSGKFRPWGIQDGRLLVGALGRQRIPCRLEPHQSSRSRVWGNEERNRKVNVGLRVWGH